MHTRLLSSLVIAGAAIAFTGAATAQNASPATLNPEFVVYENPDGTIVAYSPAGTWVFDSWQAYVSSAFFRRYDVRCGTETVPEYSDEPQTEASTSDCNSSRTNANAEYAPGALYRIPVVVHIFESTSGAGAISDAQVQSQIDILNEDFLALSGSNGATGNDTQIEFYLATQDPGGNPTTGITRDVNNDWYNDVGAYYNTVAWDTNNYLNIYTNTAGGYLGYAYVPSGGGVVGQPWEGVRVLWAAFGANAPIGPPYNLGRTTTHEVGHYLGLYHTFDGGCQGGPCNRRGDLICDTNKEASPNFSPCTRSTCGSPDPTDNYMDYSDDICMDEFTSDQLRRMRCTIEAWRVDLADTVVVLPGQATNPNPGDGATNVSTSTSVSWSAGTSATSHDVYFGTNPTPAFQGNQPGTTYSPGSLANSTTYYWQIDSVNGAGTTPGALWSFTTDAGGGGNTLFSDGFESGNFGAGGWTIQNTNARVTGAAANTGSSGAQLRAETWIERAVDTTGATGVRLLYDRRTNALDDGEFLAVEWDDGSGWATVETTGFTSSWASQDFPLGSGADNNASFRIRFSLNANRNNEKAYIDNVSVVAD